MGGDGIEVSEDDDGHGHAYSTVWATDESSGRWLTDVMMMMMVLIPVLWIQALSQR